METSVHADTKMVSSAHLSSKQFLVLLITSCHTDDLYPPARPSTPVSHAPGVTSRFWLARRRPQPVCACPMFASISCARPSLSYRPSKPRPWPDSPYDYYISTVRHWRTYWTLVCIYLSMYLEPFVDALEVEDVLTRQFTDTLSVDKLWHTDHTWSLCHRPRIITTGLFHRVTACVWQVLGGRCRELERR